MYRLFGWAFLRHEDHESQTNADYEVCSNPICRIAWWLENWLWYGGEAVP